jgi:hypothetical protein
VAKIVIEILQHQRGHRRHGLTGASGVFPLNESIKF